MGKSAPGRVKELAIEVGEAHGAKMQKISEGPLLNRKRSIHIGFPDGQRWVEKNAVRQGPVMEADCNRRRIPRTERFRMARGLYDCEITGPD